MPPILIRILGTLTIISIGGGIGSIAGIAASYVISISRPGAVFNYRLALIYGLFFGACGLVKSIRELWLR